MGMLYTQYESLVTILTYPSTTGFQRGDLTLAGIITVPLCSAQA